MGHGALLTTLLVALMGWTSGGLVAQDASAGDGLEARLWVGWQDEPLVRQGERVRVQFRTSRDAFVAVFRIDTDGRVRLLSPTDPRDDGYRRGGVDQDVALSGSPYWTVAEDPGMGYMFLVASPVPFDFSRFGFHRDFGWDLSSVATTVYQDPYLAMDDFIAAILPDWRDVGYALDFVTYHVDQPRDYPRFLCYDCHTYRTFDQWDPYEAMCSSYQVVVYDDPYFYPLYRYAGTRVVYPRLLPDRPRYEVTARRPGQAWAPIVRVRAAPPAQPRYKEAPRARPARRSGAAAPGAASAGPASSGTPARERPATRRPTPQASEPRATGRPAPPMGRPSAGVGRRPADPPRATPRGSSTGRPGAAPGRRPGGRPAAAPSGRPSGRPAATPGRRSTGRPSARPAPSSPGRGAGVGRGARPPTRPPGAA